MKPYEEETKFKRFINGLMLIAKIMLVALAAWFILYYTLIY